MGLIATPPAPRPASITHPAETAGSKGPKSSMERKPRQKTDACHIAAPEGKKPAQHTSAGGDRATPPSASRTMPKEPRGRHRETQNESHTSGGEESSSAQQAATEGGWMGTSRNYPVARRAGGKRPTQHPAPNQETTRITLKKSEETNRHDGGAGRRARRWPSTVWRKGLSAPSSPSPGERSSWAKSTRRSQKKATVRPPPEATRR